MSAQRRPLGRGGALLVLVIVAPLALCLGSFLIGLVTAKPAAAPTVAPPSKALADMDGNDWRALGSTQKRDLATRMLTALPQCKETPDWAVQNLDTLYVAPEARSQKLSESLVVLLRVDGCRSSGAAGPRG